MPQKGVERDPRVLIITASGGGGHIQAARAKTHQLKTRFKNPTIFTRDLVLDWIGKRVGRGMADLWNYAQRSGNVYLQKSIYYSQPLCDYLLGPKFFFKTLYFILRYDVDYLIDTQPVALGSMLKAAHLASWIKNKHIYLEKMIIELPTPKAIMYFNSIKRLNKKYLQHLHIKTSLPLLDKDQSEEEFWRHFCDVSENMVDTSSTPIRPMFQKDYSKIQKEDFPVSFQLHDDEEHELVARSLSLSNEEYTVRKDTLSLTLQPGDHVTTLMLGSFPSTEGVKSYVRQYVEILQEKQTPAPHYLFVFCSHKDSSNPLLHILHSLIDELMPFNNKICVLPFYFQDDEVIAPLLARSQITITRSGAITTHELLSVSQGRAFVHSELKSPPFTQERLKTAMPLWEEGNAEYLQKKIGARLIHPSTFKDELKNIL